MRVSPRTIMLAAIEEYRRGRMEFAFLQEDVANPEFKEWLRPSYYPAFTPLAYPKVVKLLSKAYLNINRRFDDSVVFDPAYYHTHPLFKSLDGRRSA